MVMRTRSEQGDILHRGSTPIERKPLKGVNFLRPVLSSPETMDTELWLRALLSDEDPLEIEDFFPLDGWHNG